MLVQPVLNVAGAGLWHVANATDPPHLITVVIPTHDRPALLRGCLKSLLRASVLVRPEDVIVVDDDSTSDIRSVADEFGVRYVRVSEGEPGRTRNRGLELCTSEFVLFLDDDDLVLPGHPDRLVRELQAHPGVGFAFGQALAFTEDDGIYGAPFPAEAAIDRSVVKTALMNASQIGTVVFRTANLQSAGGFRADLRFHEDRDVQVRLAATSGSRFVPEPVELYRVHRHSVMGTAETARQIRDLRRAGRTWRRDYGIPFRWTLEHELAVRGRHSSERWQLAGRTVASGSVSRAAKLMRDAFLLSPAHCLLGPNWWRVAGRIGRASARNILFHP